MANYNTIVVKDHTNIRENPKATAVAITPGSLLEQTAAADTVQVNSQAGVACEKMFALEDELQGKKISEDYDASAIIQVGIFRSGDYVYARLANGENAAKGAFLVSNGSGGTLKVMISDSSGTVFEEVPLAVAKEAVDFSSSSSVDPSDNLILVRII